MTFMNHGNKCILHSSFLASKLSNGPKYCIFYLQQDSNQSLNFGSTFLHFIVLRKFINRCTDQKPFLSSKMRYFGLCKYFRHQKQALCPIYNLKILILVLISIENVE